MAEPFSGVILAGGFGRRLGRDKAGALAAGRPLLHWTAEAMARVCDDLVVVRRADQTLPPPPDGLTWREVIDRRADAGPLAGIEAALHTITTGLAVVAGCDMPLLEPALLRALAAAAEGHDVVMPVLDGIEQPLLAAYRTSALPVIAARLATGDGRVRKIMPQLDGWRMERAEIERHDPSLVSFTNVNYPADLERVGERLRAGESTLKED